ncbi:uncharacterized protein LOC126908847 [Daktulosphaira vitifoliae]|uniref:uncharacterized protein LOC126908847 n=1 Tax=Daktulosphaira vitifoliae TaxID=58002 RepID=UPI0021AA438E|nr:uncharacterized protein LOC126908847 [Daktulosphaira vitifoliae]
MFKKNILYEFFLFWYLNQVLVVYCDTQSEDFKKYVINSLNHIRVQNGWDSIQQTEIKLENFTINTKSVTSEIIDENNFIQKLYHITSLLNCEYSNIMQTFNVILNLVLNKCKVNYVNKQYDALIYCTEQIIDIFKYSINMFQIMLKTAKYLENIDLRIIDSTTFNIKTVDYEINYFYEYARDLKYPPKFMIYNTVVTSYENIKCFYNKTKLMLSNLYKNKKVCGTEYKSSISTNLLIKYNIDQMEKLIEDSDDYINDIHKDLELYKSRIIENCISKLGFEQLDGTNTFKYIHSKYKIYGLYDGIALCNHFLSCNGWKSLKHIAVKTDFTNENLVYFKDITETVDTINYYFVRSCLSLILRCRYIEILRNFNVMLGQIINVCKYENKINCAVKLYKTLMTSDDMFKKMLTALTTLRYYKKNKNYRHQEVLIEKLLEFFIDFLNDVGKKYFSSLIFTNDGLYDAQSFLEHLEHVHAFALQRKFYDVNQYNMKYCKIINCETDIITTFLQLIQTNTLTEYSIIHHDMCDYLESFVLKVVKNDYEYLGFNDLPCKN